MNVAAGTLRAEVRKTAATRGTWVASGLLVALTVGFSLFLAGGTTTDATIRPGDNDIVTDALAGVAIGVIVAAVIGAVAIGNEYGSGMIASSFAAQPNRRKVVVAKATIVGLLCTVLGEIAAFVSFFAVRPIQRRNGFDAPAYPDPDLTSEPVLRAVLGTGVLIGLIGLLALGIGLIVKRTAITIPVVIGLLLVPAMVAVDEDVARTVQSVTPFAGFAIQHTVDRRDYYTAPWTGLAVTAAYAAVAVAGGIVVTRRRDV
jgi:ABC-2 type transport system permease protein